MHVETRGAKILLVDDEPDMTAIVGRSLRLNGYEVLTAGDGFECLNVAESEQPDLILLDNVMPNMDGVTAMRLLREGQSTQHIPVIIVTALADEATLSAALQAGADDYVVKPFDYGELLEKIAAVLSSRPLTG
ncbi:MAG TPA: response regulator [Anaerohalosphaeraceae bacterium]|jgi:DNA-binding response OmpR family regulator|nr:response regulator [Anaerohalosphaeraceae bacterium]HRT49789.1 response regulator [Anaerohalosphaeraceae bacterium]HRT85551.1 response regulator [Anaerohalosphaeraceae bacterium]